MQQPWQVEEPDKSTLHLIKCTFPEGLQEVEYFPLLFVLTEEMTYRAASHFIAQVLGKSDHAKEYLDCLAVRSSIVSDMEIVENLKKRLNECGWYSWLNEDPTQPDK